MSDPTRCTFCDDEPIIGLESQHGKKLIFLCRSHTEHAITNPAISESTREKLRASIRRDDATRN